MATSEPFPTIGSVFVANSVVPASHIPKRLSEKEAKRFSTLTDGRPVFSKPMLWVVINTFARHWVCLPINTYRGQGTTKPGLAPGDHGIAYDSRGEATLLPGEDHLDAYAIVVNPRKQTMIDPASRIDFSKPSSIDKYQQMSEIGMIDHSHLQAFQEHFLRVHTTSATHEYENTYTGESILSASCNRAVVDSVLLDMDKDDAVQPVALTVRKEYTYIWFCCSCGLSSLAYWPLCSIIVCWESYEWELDNG
ncbi:hypothetical protein CC80DRAFT_495806 [Byssothecium circinans]|uniref:DUF6590 domain-containing protein n=1 Tax=Byssothecium circinans TaxID=147558 RepID=A0A6A5TIE6_9PLEO|nr:hypothetical protein CC80DRAFT_495806 [Byssothecium circinans]